MKCHVVLVVARGQSRQQISYKHFNLVADNYNSIQMGIEIDWSIFSSMFESLKKALNAVKSGAKKKEYIWGSASNAAGPD